MDVKREELEKIWSWLVKRRINSEDLEWLRDKKPGLFSGDGLRIPKSNREALEMLQNPEFYKLSLVCSSTENFSYAIQDILDAIWKKNTYGYRFAGGMPEDYLIKMASMLDIEESERFTKSELTSSILREIS